MTSHSSARHAFWLAAAMACGTWVSQAFFCTAGAASAADRYPDHAVRIIVPVSAGGSADKLARTLAMRLSEKWGQTVLVDNIPGASSAIGNATVARAKGDGYTLLLGNESLSLNALKGGAAADPLRELTGITKAVANPQLLVVRPDLGVRNFAEFAALVKKHPGEISVALPGGAGSLQELAVQSLDARIGAETNQIPYLGGGPAMLAVLGGHVDAMLITLAAAADNVRAGKLIGIAVTTPYRSTALPDVPTLQQAGLADYSVESWQGLLAPASTPPAIVDKIHEDVVAVLREPATRALLENLGYTIAASSAEAVNQTVAEDITKYRKPTVTANLDAPRRP